MVGNLEEKAEERKLVKKAMRGNADAYGELIEVYKTYLYKLAFAYMKNQEDALDVVGTTILKGFQSIRSLKNPELFKTWITKILINTANDELRKVIYYSDIDDLQVPDRHKGVSPEEKCDLNEALERLPEKYRKVIILKYFSQMTIEEIAFAADIPAGSVKAYLSRGRQELKKYLKEDYMYAESV